VADVDIGTLAGKVALEDKTSVTVDLVLSKVTALDSKFEGLNSHVVQTAEGFVVAEGAIRLFEKGVETAVEVLKDMTVEGSKIGDIEGNFDHLTESAGRLGSTLLNELREGTHNTVSDLNLIKVANSDLGAGLDLTDKQFHSIATGAFAIAHSKGLEVKSTLDDINDALVKGQARGVQYLVGRVDVAKAEDAFAASLETTADHLNAEGQAQAARLAIMEAVDKATARLGTQTHGLGDIIAQMQTKWDNAYESLSKSVATSPVVIAAFETVRDSLVSAFGGDSQHMVETIAHWVDYFAGKVIEYTPTVVAGFISIKNWIADTIATVRQDWDTLPLWLRTAATDALLAGGAFLTLNTGVKLASGGSFDLVGTLGNLTTTLVGLPGVIRSVGAELSLVKGLSAMDFSSFAVARTSVNLLGESAVGLVGTLGAVGIAAGAIFAAWEIGKTQRVSDFFEGLGLSLRGFTQDEIATTIASEHLFEKQKQQDEAAKAQKASLDRVKAAMDELRGATDQGVKSQDDANKALDKNRFILDQTRDELKKRAEALKEIESVSEDYHKTVEALDATVVTSIEHYLAAGVSQDKLAAYYKLTAAQIAAVAKELDYETKSESDSLKRWADYNAERLALSGSTTDREIADIARWEAAQIKSHVDAKIDTADFYTWLGETVRLQEDQQVKARLVSDTHSKAYWDQQKVDAEDAYTFATRHADQFTNDYIEDLRQTKVAATDAALHWRDQMGGALDSFIEKAHKLSAAMNFSMDVNSGNFAHALSDASRNWQGATGARAIGKFSTSGGEDLARKGYSFQEIVDILTTRDQSPGPPKGPRIPGFKDGGIGDFGDGTLAMLHGKEAIIPLEQAGAMVTNHFYVNGTAEDVARKVGDIFMTKLKMTRALPTAG
jgi:hypothetical protein